MTEIYKYILDVLTLNNVENPHLGARMLTSSNNIFGIELAIRHCELELFKQNESFKYDVLRNSLLFGIAEGWNVEIVEDYQVEVSFDYGNNYPQPDTSLIPLVIYKALLQDFYFSIKDKNFYPNGQIKYVGHYDNHFRNGIWITYFENGKIKTHGQYIHSKKHGTWIYYYEDGQIKAKEYYDVNCNRTGEWHTWYPDGKIESITNFKNNEFIGDYKRWYKNGQLHVHQQYDEPLEYCGRYSCVRKDGEHFTWYESGDIKSISVIKDNQIVEVREYGDWGKPKLSKEERKNLRFNK
jgi:antitoxin component YwqK of YwqJK toxin-antitoxin module